MSKEVTVMIETKKLDAAIQELSKDTALLLVGIDDTFLEFFMKKYSYLLMIRNDLPIALRIIQFQLSNLDRRNKGPRHSIAKLIGQLEEAKTMQWSNQDVHEGHEKAKTVQSDKG